MSRSLAIIIPHWHGENFLPTCLESISGCVFDEDIDYSVVIVHNGGPDPVIPHAMRTSAKILRTAENIGFARAVNVGLQHVLNQRVDFIAILNQDTRVSSNCFQALIHAVADAHACYAPLIMTYDMTVVPSWYATKYYPEGVPSADQELSEVQLMSGTCVLGNRKSFVFGGFFDPAFYMYYEDDDYFDRFRSRGGKLFVVPTAQVGHFSGSTESEDGKSMLWRRTGVLKFVIRHRSRWKLCRKLIRHYGSALYRIDFRRLVRYLRSDYSMLLQWNYFKHASHQMVNTKAADQIQRDTITSV